MKRALSPSEILKIKHEIIPFTGKWFDAFGTPERVGVWFIFGGSGSGKSSFIMQLCKELGKYGKVLVDALEEKTSLTMQNSIRRFNMTEINGRIGFGSWSMDELSKMLEKRRSADFVIIDSFQYSQLTYKSYIKFKEKHPNKLLIFVSHANGNNPLGRSAVSVLFDADLKIKVEGYRAKSRGRYIGSVGYYDIWEERALKYWGGKEERI